MANKLKLRVVTPAKDFFNGECDMAVLKTIDGDTGILYGHQPLTTVLDLGYLRIIDNNNEKRSTMLGGFAKVNSEGLTIISEAAEWADEIDVQRALESKKRAEQRLEQGGKDNDEVDVLRAEASLKRALLRLGLAEK